MTCCWGCRWGGGGIPGSGFDEKEGTKVVVAPAVSICTLVPDLLSSMLTAGCVHREVRMYGAERTRERASEVHNIAFTSSGCPFIKKQVMWSNLPIFYTT